MKFKLSPMELIICFMVILTLLAIISFKVSPLSIVIVLLVPTGNGFTNTVTVVLVAEEQLLVTTT